MPQDTRPTSTQNTWVEWGREWVSTQTGGTGTMVGMQFDYGMPDMWTTWNTQFTTTANATATVRVDYIADNAMTVLTETATVMPTHITTAWVSWNDIRYVQQQPSREQHIARIKADARRLGHQLRTLESVNVEVAWFSAKDIEWTDDLRREVLDEHQRGWEETVERNRAAERRAAQTEAAQRKAELLLISLLTQEQKEEWLAHKRVTQVAASGRVWRLFPSWSGGAVIMDGEVRRATLCVHPAERIPDADVMVALLTAIRCGDEALLIKTAILHGGTWSPEELDIRAGRQVRVEAVPGGEVERLVG